MNKAKSETTVSMLTISGSPTDKEKNQALTDFRAAVDSITSKISALTNNPGDLESISVAADELANKILSVKAKAESLIVKTG